MIHIHTYNMKNSLHRCQQNNHVNYVHQNYPNATQLKNNYNLTSYIFTLSNDLILQLCVPYQLIRNIIDNKIC